MRERLAKILRITLGVIALLLGVAGLFLPVLQGVLFLLIGFYLLSKDIPWVRRQWEKIRCRYPNAFARWELWKENFKTHWPRWKDKRKTH
jgi:uncharacterized protein